MSAPHTDRCPDAPLLRRWVHDELPPEDAARVEGHVGDCPSCQQALDAQGGALSAVLFPLAAEQNHLADDVPPRLVGYEPADRVDAGGMGVVWRTHDLQFRRTLAVKVMKARGCDDPNAIRRFYSEARITSQLAHPFIVPVHAMGRLADGRPYYTMKLVEGETLATLLRARPDPSARRAEFVQVFAHVCQAVAHAHSRGVIHRDLKPANVMVGAHGEVQVMDWGLAKELTAAPPAEPTDLNETADGSLEDTGERTRAGSALGSWPWMPLEQARGQVGEVDKRSDVFGLGAILCEILTGAPPYTGPDTRSIRLAATEARLGDAVGRLNACGADPELIRLAERCLAEGQSARPADAGEVAAAVSAHQGEVQERLQRERLERTAAEARADEAKVTATAERKARRRAVALVAVVLAALAVGGGVTWWAAERRGEADRGVEAGVVEAFDRLDQSGRAGSITRQVELCREAEAAARRAVKLAGGGFASHSARQKAADTLADVQLAAAAVERDRELLAALWDTHAPRVVGGYGGPAHATVRFCFNPDPEPPFTDDPPPPETAPVASGPSADQLAEDGRFTAAFRKWGLDVDKAPLADAVAAIAACPEWVREELVAALDGRAVERRRDGWPEREWRRLSKLADEIDGDDRRRALRVLLTGDQLEKERTRAQLLQPLVPMAALVVPAGPVLDRLRQQARHPSSPAGPVPSVLLLTRVLREAGDEAEAERLLQSALRERPGEVAYWDALGRLLEEHSRWTEAIACYKTVWALRPELGAVVTTALERAGWNDEALALAELLCRHQPEQKSHFVIRYRSTQHISYDSHQARQDQLAVIARDAIRHHPRDSFFHWWLALAVSESDPKATEAEYRTVLQFDPNSTPAHAALGNLLQKQSRFVEAAEHFQKVIDLSPPGSESYRPLAQVLVAQGRLDEAANLYRAEIAREKKQRQLYHLTQVEWAEFLLQFRRCDEAEAELREVLRLRPNEPYALCVLGFTLTRKGRFDDADAALRKGHAVVAGIRSCPYPFADGLKKAERARELAPKMAEVVAGRGGPLTPDERLELANLCVHCDNHCELAVTLYREAFRADPKLADNFKGTHRYNAACAAAMAGREGKPVVGDAQARADLRAQAIVWLKEESALVDRQEANDARSWFYHWKRDHDLAGIRDPKTLDKLTPAEGESFQQFWADVDRRLKLLGR